MENVLGFISPGILSQILVGLSRTVILFIVSSGLSLILGVLRIPNVAHGSLYMIGAFMAYTVSHLFGGGTAGFWMALIFIKFGLHFNFFCLSHINMILKNNVRIYFYTFLASLLY